MEAGQGPRQKNTAEHNPTSKVWALYSIMTLFMRMAIHEQEGLLALAAMTVHWTDQHLIRRLLRMSSFNMSNVIG
jgi:hypothetical protein